MKTLLTAILLSFVHFTFSQIAYDTSARADILIEKLKLEKLLEKELYIKPTKIVVSYPYKIYSTAYLNNINFSDITHSGDTLEIKGFENNFLLVSTKKIKKGFISAFHFANNEELSQQVKEVNERFLLSQDLDKTNSLLAQSYEEEIKYYKKETERIEKENKAILFDLHLDSLITKAKKLKSYIALDEAYITFNSIGVPEANILAYNISDDIIDAYTVDIYCYDNFKNPVKHYAHNSNIFKGISQNEVASGGTIESSWELHGYDNTTKIKIILTKVHFTNGKVWNSNPKNPIFIKGN